MTLEDFSILQRVAALGLLVTLVVGVSCLASHRRSGATDNEEYPRLFSLVPLVILVPAFGLGVMLPAGQRIAQLPMWIWLLMWLAGLLTLASLFAPLVVHRRQMHKRGYCVKR